MRLTPKLRCAVQAHVSSQFLEDHLFVLQPVASGQQQLSSRVVHLALQYLTHALELKDSYKLMRPHVEGLLAQVRTLTRPLLAHTAFASVRQLQTRHFGASGSVGIAADAAVRLAYSCGLSAFVRLRLCIQVWLTMCCALILQVVLPQLCFDDEDAELWEDDPQEFVRKVRNHICTQPVP
jgi:hypothetical protein